ncbi:hypothetical protein GEMMAAP_11970 [Gemmatimonas phototrophica]|uniref:Helix-turn-helix domain-containing protein n=1 Tax=Gemmatimonas phototrophica TaxID=1379270 RepID=A0A143BL53_9BACT|nr:hypothetical protein GEMMAAP_11970 [Gemmatimonas phototrophica]
MKKGIETMTADDCMSFTLWTLEEAADRLKTSESWLRKSSCPTVRINRKRLYDPKQVAAWARAHLTHRIGGAA